MFNRKYGRKALLFIFLIFLLTYIYLPYLALASQDGKTIWPAGPTVFADGAIVMEASTGLILYEKNIHTQYFPASITKILSTLLAIENSDLNDTITVSYEAEWYVSKTSSRMGLVEGEQLTMEEALYGVMLESANEATYAVGEHVSGAIGNFVSLMNTRAKELGCLNTNFANSHGLHDDNHYTTPYDMALISKAAIANPIFRKITGTSTYAMPATNKSPARLLSNHHLFVLKTLPYDYAIGGKTGATPRALNTLVTYAKKDGMTLISVVMHVDTPQHTYDDTAKLLNFAFDNYMIYNIEETELANTSTFPSLFQNFPEFVPHETNLLRVGDNGNVILPNGIPYKEAKKTITLTTPDELVHGDNVVGSVSYKYKGKTVGNAPLLYYNSAYPMTNEYFLSQWPSFLVPVDVILDDHPNQPADLDQPNTSESSQKSKVYPIFLGIISGCVVFVAGSIIILRRDKKTRN